MKTLVISAIIAMTSLVNVVSAAAVNRTDNFAYNTETNDGRVETQTVFKVENQKFLHRHLKYNYIYDNSGRISQKEVLKWNESTQSFEKHHSLNFFYTDDVTVERAKQCLHRHQAESRLSADRQQCPALPQLRMGRKEQ